MNKIMRNMGTLLSSFIETPFDVFAEKPLHDERFFEQFTNEDELKKLDDKVLELIDKGISTPQKVVLGDDREVTIMLG